MLDFCELCRGEIGFYYIRNVRVSVSKCGYPWFGEDHVTNAQEILLFVCVNVYGGYESLSIWLYQIIS